MKNVYLTVISAAMTHLAANAVLHFTSKIAFVFCVINLGSCLIIQHRPVKTVLKDVKFATPIQLAPSAYPVNTFQLQAILARFAPIQVSLNLKIRMGSTFAYLAQKIAIPASRLEVVMFALLIITS